jgi:YggT family protein
MHHSVLYNIVDFGCTLYMMMLLVRVLSSYFPEIQEHKLFRVLQFYTDPYLNLFRKFIPPLGMFDLSPIVAFFALQFLEMFLKSWIGR